MLVFKKRPLSKVARAIRISGKEETSIPRDETLGSEFGSRASKAPSPSKETGTRVRLRQAGQRVVRKGRALRMKARRLIRGGKAGSVRPENVVWIFGAGRTGSSWLSRMMEEIEGHTVWFEPWVGALFDPYHLRLEHRKGKHFILAPQYRSTWLESIRSFVLDGAEVRFPEAVGSGKYLVIKEPGGSVGATLLMEALPESRMILLVRDPRDVVASWVDARKEGGWKSVGKGPDNSAERVVRVANRYLRHVGEAKRAYHMHQGRKVLVKYEELRADTLGTMRRIYSTLGIPIDDGELSRAVKKHSWESIPEEEKGEGKFYRKAQPGGWREDLTPEQAQTVEEITAPLLQEFYPGGVH